MHPLIVFDNYRLSDTYGLFARTAVHYFQSQLPKQFDVVIHIDHTRAVEPLERTAAWEKGDVPETYPTGL